jgi:hypothetical protein
MKILKKGVSREKGEEETKSMPCAFDDSEIAQFDNYGY